MATGDNHGISINGKLVTYTEYKLQPSDLNKSLKQIARERLGAESLFDKILRKRENVPLGQQIWEEIPLKDRIDPNWTLLLPPAQAAPAPSTPEYKTFKLLRPAYVRTSPRVEAANTYNNTAFPQGTIWNYRTNNIHRENGMVWVEVTTSNIGKKIAGATYWMCVREGSLAHSDPPIS